jgi:hypothetical protein
MNQSIFLGSVKVITPASRARDLDSNAGSGNNIFSLNNGNTIYSLKAKF